MKNILPHVVVGMYVKLASHRPKGKVVSVPN